MSAEAPEQITPENADQFSAEEIEAYNEQKEAELEQRLAERIGNLSEQEEEAMDALVGDAEETVATTTVTLESGLELEVRERMPAAVERMHSRLQHLQKRGATPDEIAEVNCKMLAEICETGGYDSADPWYIAYRSEDAGIQWLTEVTATMLEPAYERAEATQGKLDR